MTVETLRPARPTANRRRAGSRFLKYVAAIALLCLVWLMFAPTALGGRTNYVVTVGNSMLPKYRANSLVITRVQDTYQVGDVVAYRNADMRGATVLHRIVARKDGKFVLQGDNNNFLDRYRPSTHEIVGVSWVYWEGAGRYIAALRDPINFAIIIGVITVLSVRTPSRGHRRRRHHGA